MILNNDNINLGLIQVYGEKTKSKNNSRRGLYRDPKETFATSIHFCRRGFPRDHIQQTNSDIYS